MIKDGVFDDGDPIELLEESCAVQKTSHNTPHASTVRKLTRNAYRDSRFQVGRHNRNCRSLWRTANPNRMGYSQKATKRHLRPIIRWPRQKLAWSLKSPLRLAYFRPA